MAQIDGCYAGSLRIVGKHDDFIFLHDLQEVCDLLETRLLHVKASRLRTEIRNQNKNFVQVENEKLIKINFKITLEILIKK